MAARKKGMTYKGKPVYRVGDRIYYGNLEDRFILALDVTEKEKLGVMEVPTKVKILLMDNTGKLGEGQIYRKAERANLYQAFDRGEWWLKDALQMTESN